MKAAFLRAPFCVDFRDVPETSPGPGEVLVRPRLVGICGSDIHSARHLARTWQRFGHEATGEIVEVGPGVTGLRAGDLVACQGTSACGFCAGCMVGRLERCQNRHLARQLGYFAERVVVNRRNVWKLDGLSIRAGVLLEPMGVAIDMVRLAEIGLDSSVVIVGPGPIGLMALRLTRHRGARRLYAVGVARDVTRFALCRELGADACIDAEAVDPAEAVLELTGGRGADAVIDTATIASLPSALAMCAFGGRVVFAGESSAVAEEARPVPGRPSPGSVLIDVNWLHLHRLELRGSYAVPHVSLPLGHMLLSDGLLDADRLVTHVFPFADLQAALVAVHERRGDVIKAAVEVNL